MYWEREILCCNTEGVDFQRGKHMENGQNGMKFHIRKHRETDYTGVRLDRIYCIPIKGHEPITFCRNPSQGH